MKSILRIVLFVLSGLCVFHSVALAQNRCANTPDYFEPTASGDGQRYALTMGPLTWHLVGSGVYPVKGSDRRTHLAFAMQFTNSWGAAATIQSVEVLDPSRDYQPTGTNRVVSAKDEDITGLVKLSTLPGSMDKASYSARLAGGQSGVMYFDVGYAAGDQAPCTIALRVRTVQPEVKRLPESTVLSPPLRVNQEEAIILAPAFKGGGWVDMNGCCLEIGPHRFVTNPVNGTLDPSEQFAIDWIKVDAQGKAFRTDGKASEDWLCYGVELLAVAPGTVVESVRDMPDVPPGAAPANLTIAEFTGNHVTLDLGNGRYAVYAHMAPHSVAVHVGDQVKTGDKLGLLGNSGNTTGPHLHFQISDRPSTLDTTALPFVFESMVLENRTSADMDDMDIFSIKGTPLPMNPTVAKPLARTMPLSRDGINFQ
jgi:hypothetical protein